MTDTLVITNNYMDCILERISKKQTQLQGFVIRKDFKTTATRIVYNKGFKKTATTRIVYNKGFKTNCNNYKDCI